MSKDLTPIRTAVETDTYALVIFDGGQVLYQYEEPTPWEDPQWIEKRQYEHDEVPTLNLEQTQVEQRTDGGSLQTVTLYATEIGADEESVQPDDRDTDDPAPDEEYRGYVIQFSDGNVIPDENNRIYTQQRENMGAAVEYLVTEHDLIDAVDIPHVPQQARKNCSINSEPIHPNGDEMRSPYNLTGGYYLHTSLSGRSKKSRIRDLAEQVNLSVEFLGEW